MRTTKKSLVSSVVALLLCFSMLLGSTFAWFTDSAISGGNIVQSGRLDVEMYWSETLLAADSNEWKNADGVPVFTYDNWEPGYTDIKYVKIKNAGNLALQWRLSIAAEGKVSELADVIDVYYINPVSETVSTLDDKSSIGVLCDVINTHKYTSGILLPEGKTSAEYKVGETILAIAFHMQEEAGNEYKGKTIGDGFSLSLMATQFSWENDAFNKDYDKNPEWPNNVIVGGNSATADVVPDADNKVSGAVSLLSKDGKINASVPAGVMLGNGTNKLTLSVKDVANSKANITLDQTEAAMSIDVHIDGVAANNDVVMAIGIKELLPVGLNMGNYRFYHVENGATVEMQLLADGATPVHNNYEYDPSTGDVVLHLKSFSEVALVADTENAWEGAVDHSWYVDKSSPYTIANADQLWSFSQIVGGMAEDIKQDSFEGKTVKLIADINLGYGVENHPYTIFYPIGYYNSTGSYGKTSGVSVTSSVSSFEGTFDGNGNTIANFYQNTWEMFGDYNDGYSGTPNHYKDAMGLFGYVLNGTIKNLTVSNFSSDGEYTPTGVIAAYADGNSTFENIAITNCNPRVYNTGNGGIIGIAGDTSAANDDHITLKNITVDNSNKISALWGSWDVACGGLVGMYRGNVDGNGNATGDTVSFESCHVSAIIDVYNDVCANYQYYAYRYSGMIIGSVRHNTKNAEGKVIPDMTGIYATGCTVNYGDWNDYYYCEFEKNTMASYSPDYQFSRVPHSELNFTDSNGNGVVDADERASVTGCKHTHTAEENHQAIYLPFHQLFTGYSWGVSSIGLKEYSGIVTDLGITEGDQQESVKKFENKGVITTYRPGQTITVGDLFKVVDGLKVDIISSSVYVAVSPATENDKGSATYSNNVQDWTQGTIKLAEDCSGSLKVVITDYFFCTETVIYLEAEQAAEKFTANTVGVQAAYTQITLGNLFGIKNGAKIGNVTATVTDPNGNEITVTGTSADWATKTIDLIKEGTWTVAIKDDDAYCSVTTATFTVNKVDKFTKKFDKNFLYRVGNANTVALGSIFGEIETVVGLSSVNVSITPVAGNAAGTFTGKTPWTSATIQFTGTGVVKVTISADGANSVELMLEVVDAWNAITALSAPYVEKNNKDEVVAKHNVVLLNDVENGSFTTDTGYGFYGNGFTIKLDPNSHSLRKGNGYAGYIHMRGGVIDNVRIEGPVFAESYIYQSQGLPAGTTNADSIVNYVRNAICIDSGDAVITNSYISGARTVICVKSGGNVTIDNSRIVGGAYANIEVLSADSLTLKNVVTEQKETLDSYSKTKQVIGTGIVINNATTKLILDGLTQYNWMTESQWNSMLGEYKMAFPQLFKNTYTSIQYTYNDTIYVNTGIIWACDMSAGPSVEGMISGYDYTEVSLSSNKGCVYTMTKASGASGVLSSADVIAPEYEATTQGAVPPTPSFDYTGKNNEPEQSGSNDYCYYKSDAGKFLISFDQGETKNWYSDILTVRKGTNTLPYTVSVSGTAVVNANNTITFKDAGDYVVTYTYTDSGNYKLDNGEIVTYSKTYYQYVYVTVFVVEPQADPTIFDFGSDGYKSVTAGGLTYVMPDVTATKEPTKSNYVVTASGIGSKTIDGQTIYYPIIGMHKVGSSMSYYNYFSIFEAITIKDANGTDIYNINTPSVPDKLQVIGGFIDNGSESANGTAIFNYSTGKTITTKTVTVKGTNVGLCYYPNSSFSSSTTARPEQTIVVKYCYTDSNGKAYYYYIGYWCAQGQNGVESSSSGSSGGDNCVTPDTLITLANGTQVRVDSLTGREELLVWNMETGRFDKAPIMFVDSEAEAEFEVIKLKFSDGTEVKVISEHGFWDYDLNKYVYLDKNAADYIGHTFAKQNGDKLEKVTLVDVVIETELTTAWSPVTAGHLCYFVNGMLSMPGGVGGLFNIFEVDAETMTYDFEAMQKDIETYGLYTYEELNAICPLSEEMFNAAGGAYLKISIGKGNLTIDELINMINRYSQFFN